MELRNRTTGAIKSDPQFRAEHPNTSFPRVLTAEILSSYGYDPILEGPQVLTSSPYEICQRLGVEQIGDQWFTKYGLGPVFEDNEAGTAAEQEAAYRQRIDAEVAERVKQERLARLNETDWTQLGDSPVQPVNEWRTYRQALRDIPSQPGYPHNIDWPEPPNPIER